MRKPIRILLASVAVLAMGGVALASGKDKAVAVAPPTMDIVDTAVAAGSFNTLVTAVKAAGLVETLKGTGPFTVFAPTDDAFAKLPKGTLEGLLADKAKLTQVLTYHVVSGKVLAADVLKLKDVTTLQGGKAMVDAKAVTIDGVKIVKTDIVCSNGVIHVIDAVMLP
jgi:uncharacterized surface protein with fasciclin (FAS1) repeats